MTSAITRPMSRMLVAPTSAITSSTISSSSSSESGSGMNSSSTASSCSSPSACSSRPPAAERLGRLDPPLALALRAPAAPRRPSSGRCSSFSADRRLDRIRPQRVARASRRRATADAPSLSSSSMRSTRSAGSLRARPRPGPVDAVRRGRASGGGRSSARARRRRSRARGSPRGPRCLRGLGDEVEHALRLVGRELADVAERVDVALGEDEQVRRRPSG